MLETLYLIAQILAALAIVGSLIFVGAQIKSHTREQRQLRILDRNQTVLAFHNMFTNSAQTRETFIRGLESFHALSPESRVLFDSIMTTLSRSVLIYHRQLIDGDITEENWRGYLDYVLPFLGSPGGKEWVEIRGRIILGSSFVMVEPYIGSAEGLAAYEYWRTGFVENADA